jgi:glycosyltransferase involved in cell wall biosynthesis
MRILMLAQAYRPIIGGEERYVEDLSVQLASRGHTVSIATLAYKGTPHFEVDRGVRVHRVRGTVDRAARILFKDSSRLHAPPVPDPELVNALRRVILREQPQIVHAHDWMVHSFLPLKPWSRAKLVMHLHDYSLQCAKKTLLHYSNPCSGPGFSKCLRCGMEHYGSLKGVSTVSLNWLMGMAERTAVDKFIAISRAVATTGRLADGRPPFEVIPNFVPDDITELPNTPMPDLSELPKEAYLLFVGALSRKKGIDVLLNAYSKLNSPPPLVLIGYTTVEYPIDLSDLPANVVVLKDVPDHRVVMAARSRSLMALIPSLWAEPFGIVALEAMASGRPIIASRHGGLVDTVVDGETGILVPPNDSDALRRAIERLLADSALREQMGQAAKRRLMYFQASTVVPRIEQLYSDLIQC